MWLSALMKLFGLAVISTHTSLWDVTYDPVGGCLTMLISTHTSLWDVTQSPGQPSLFLHNFNSHISMRCDDSSRSIPDASPYFNSHISMRCDYVIAVPVPLATDFNSHISMRCDINCTNLYIIDKNFNSHISMRCDVSCYRNEPEHRQFQLTHLYEMWPLYMVRDNFQTTKYSNSKQNIVKLITKVSKIIAKRLIFSAKALEKKASLQVRHNVFKCVFCLFKILRYYKLL